MKRIDLHGKKRTHAEELFWEFLNESRQKQKMISVCFITGTGVIREHLISLCDDNNIYCFTWDPGQLRIDFE